MVVDCVIDTRTWWCRPAYMDEYEKLEEELQQVYDDYMLKFRNQAYLENILDEQQRAQLDENEVSLFAVLTSVFLMLPVASSNLIIILKEL